MKDSNNKTENNPISCADSVFQKIQQEGVTPHGRWYFILKNELFWGVGAFSVIVGSCMVAAALFAISNSDFATYEITHDSFFEFSYDALPLIWIFGLALFLAVGFWQIKSTQRGYRYPVYIIIGSSLVLSVASGIALHSFGYGERFENQVSPYIPFHKLSSTQREQIWINSAKGIVAGEVIALDVGTSTFVIRDFSGRPWIINGESLSEYDFSLLQLNEKVRIVGIPELPSVLASTSLSTIASTTTSTRNAATPVTTGENSSSTDGILGIPSLNSLMLATSTLQACIVLPWDSSLPMTRTTLTVQDAGKQGEKMINTLREKEITDSERNISGLRNIECKDVRPYQLLMKMRSEAQ